MFQDSSDCNTSFEYTIDQLSDIAQLGVASSTSSNDVPSNSTNTLLSPKAASLKEAARDLCKRYGVTRIVEFFSENRKEFAILDIYIGYQEKSHFSHVYEQYADNPEYFLFRLNQVLVWKRSLNKPH